MQNTNETKKKKIGWLIPILTVILMIVALDLVVHMASVKEKSKFTPPAFDAKAVSGAPKVPEELGYTELYQEGMAYRVSVCGMPSVKGKNLDVYFTNEKSNGCYLKLRILDTEDQILGQTGLLKPGEYVQKVVLDKEIVAGTGIKLKVMSYDPETYESVGAVVLNVTVQDAD